MLKGKWYCNISLKQLCVLFSFFPVSATETFPYIELGVTPGRGKVDLLYSDKSDSLTVYTIVFPFLFSHGREVKVR